jgi:hypothetical protein
VVSPEYFNEGRLESMTPEISEMQAIRQRLARVERQNSMVKRTALVIFLVAGALVAMGQAPVKRTVTADEFILKDSAGIVRATLGFAGVSHEQLLLSSTRIDEKGPTGAQVLRKPAMPSNGAVEHPT